MGELYSSRDLTDAEWRRVYAQMERRLVLAGFVVVGAMQDAIYWGHPELPGPVPTSDAVVIRAQMQGWE